MKTKNNKVSFITINYNSSVYTIELINSIIAYTKNIDYEVIVVDNNSKNDDLNNLKQFIKSLEKIQLIENDINCGFSCGNMLGRKHADGEYLFFINNDTKLLNNTALLLKEYMDNNPQIGLSTAKILDQNNKFSSSYKLFPSLTKAIFGNGLARKLSKHKFPSNKAVLKENTLVAVVSGSCMFFRASVFDLIGGFDSNFFLYCEEEDISKRVWDNNFNVAFVPDAKIYHHAGGSTKQNFEIEREYYISYKYLLSKHFGFFSQKILLFLTLIKLFRRSFKRKDGWRLFLFGLQGFPQSHSLKFKNKKLGRT